MRATPCSSCRRREARVIGVKLTVRDPRTRNPTIAAASPHPPPPWPSVTGCEDLLPAALYPGADGTISGMADLVDLVAAVSDGTPNLHHFARTHQRTLRRR